MLQEEHLCTAQERKSHWEVSIAKSKAELAKAKQNLNKALREACLEKIIEAENMIKSLEGGLEIALKHFPVLFPSEEI